MNENVLKCSCVHEHQDKIYGKGQRVHTKSNKGHRCTVCNNVQSDGSTPSRKK